MYCALQIILFIMCICRYSSCGDGLGSSGGCCKTTFKFLGHVLREDELEKLVVIGFEDGKRVRDRQRATFLTYLGKMKQKLPMERLYMA